MPKLKWVSLFFIEQVKVIPDDDTEITQAIKSIGQVSTVLQDNTSTIQFEKNGRLQGKQTRHVEIKYVYISEQIKEGHIQVLYCPTKQIVADYFSKPLQGSLFQIHRNTIMGVTMEDLIKYKRIYTESKMATSGLAS